MCKTLVSKVVVTKFVCQSASLGDHWKVITKVVIFHDQASSFSGLSN